MLVVVTALLLAGTSRADDCSNGSGLLTLQPFCMESAAEPNLSDLSKKWSGPAEETDANTPLGLSAPLRLRFAALRGDPAKAYRLEMPDFSYATLRGGRIKLGEHPFLPWMEIHSESGSEERGFSIERQRTGEGTEDRFRGSPRRLGGGYFQVGYFFHEWWERFPPSLEIAGRIALVEPKSSTGSGLQEEWTLGANWFLPGHANRIAAGVSYIAMDRSEVDEPAMRFQVRWDIAF